jgi:dTDP-4-dehydrorhamnose 3,5-epimerase
LAEVAEFRALGLGNCTDIWEVIPERFCDQRCAFSEVCNREVFRRHGARHDFVQDNQSLSLARGTVRGLHFQAPPHAQAKLVRVLRGAIFDVALDVRRGSPTYGRHVALTLSARDGNQVLIPAGFAHGFCTLEPDTEVLYKVDTFYSRQHEHGVLWCDRALGIEWPVAPADAVVSEKDQALPLLSGISNFFTYSAKQ